MKSRSLNDFVNWSSKKLIRYASLRKTSVSQHEITVYRQVWKLLNKSAPHMSFSCNLWHLHQPKDNLDDKKWYEMYFPIGYKLVHFRRFTNLYTCKGLQVKCRLPEDFVVWCFKKLIRYAGLRKNSFSKRIIIVYRTVVDVFEQISTVLVFLLQLGTPTSDSRQVRWQEVIRIVLTSRLQACQLPEVYKFVNFWRFTKM